MPVERRGLLAGLLLPALLVLAACTRPVEVPTVTPSPSPTPRDFTVATSGPISTADPAIATADTDTMIATTVFQRLMMVIPGTGELKPDAATDCLFSSETVYECTLPEGLRFHNGDELTSSDVRFSIQRALRLDVAGTSIPLLASLKRIDTPDALTVRFVLNFSDNQFGYALATLSTSIVDEQLFDPDSGLPLEVLPVGSGPFEVTSISADEVIFDRFDDYVGPLGAQLERIRLEHVTDSVAAETAITEGTVDVVWRTLDDAALQRISDEIAADPDKATAKGFTRWPLPDGRTNRLIWNPGSGLRGNATLREGVMLALQQDRTLRSLVPAGVAGSVDSFAAGGAPVLPEIDGKRTILTLGYNPTAPGHADLASLLRSRIESLDNVSVRLVTGTDADLYLSDEPPWVGNAFGWLLAYTDEPLPGSELKIGELEQRARTTIGDARDVALGEIQQQAAVDATVVPVSSQDGILIVGPGVTLVGSIPFGSGGQLGLWAIAHA